MGVRPCLQNNVLSERRKRGVTPQVGGTSGKSEVTLPVTRGRTYFQVTPSVVVRKGCLDGWSLLRCVYMRVYMSLSLSLVVVFGLVWSVVGIRLVYST